MAVWRKARAMRPAGWSHQQVELSRRFVLREIDGEVYGHEFFIAQSNAARATEFLPDPLDELVNDLLFALSNHSPFDDERLPDQLDDEQLRAVVAQHLADYDAGRYGPGNG